MSDSALKAHMFGDSFTYADARGWGLSRRRLGKTDVAHPFRDVYALGADLTDLEDRCRALAPHLRSDHWFSHRTAARLWGIPLPDGDDDVLDVLAIGTHNRARRAQVCAWETDDTGVERDIRAGIPLVAPQEAWCQLATLPRGIRLRHEDLVAAADFVLSGIYHPGSQTWNPLCTRAGLEAAVRRRGRRRGTRMLREALERARPFVGSSMETRLRLGLVDHGLPEPDRQILVDTAQGRRFADLGYPEAKLLLEYQGDRHRVDRRRWLRDLTRIQLFEDAGYRCLFIGAHDVLPDCTALAARVGRALAGRTFTPTPGH